MYFFNMAFTRFQCTAVDAGDSYKFETIYRNIKIMVDFLSGFSMRMYWDE